MSILIFSDVSIGMLFSESLMPCGNFICLLSWWFWNKYIWPHHVGKCTTILWTFHLGPKSSLCTPSTPVREGFTGTTQKCRPWQAETPWYNNRQKPNLRLSQETKTWWRVIGGRADKHFHLAHPGEHGFISYRSSPSLDAQIAIKELPIDPAGPTVWPAWVPSSDSATLVLGELH